MRTTNAAVRDALAHHAGRHVSTLEDWQHLELDLYLTPHDLIGIVRQVADTQGFHVPAPDPATIATVGDLVRFVWSAGRRVREREREHVASAARGLRCW